MSIVASLDRVPPQNLDAEQGVLGSMLLDRDAIARVVELIRAEDFYRDAHRRIFEAMADLFERGEPVDLITVTDRLRDKGQLDDVGGAAYVTSLLNAVPTAANVEYYSRIVLQKSMLRQLISAGTQIAQMGFEANQDVELLVDQAEKLVFSIANRRLVQEFQPIREILKESFERIDRRYQDKGTVTGVPMGFTDLDQLTSGLQPGDLTIIAARPSMGKCLKYDAELVDAGTGEVYTIQEVVARGRTRLFTLLDGGVLAQAEPSQFVDDGIKPVFRVRTASGREVETTLTHPFLTPSGWRRLEEIRPGERIAVPARLPVFGTADLPAYEVKLLAYLCAEMMPTSPVLAADYADAVAVGEAIRAATKVIPSPAGDHAHEPGGEIAAAVLPARSGALPPVQGGAVPEVVGALHARHPELGRSGDARSIPPAVFTLPREKVALFLSRLLACTGTVATDPEISVSCALPSVRMARQVRHLLLRFGVPASLAGATLTVAPAHAQALFREVGIVGWERLRAWARYDQEHLLPAGDILWDPVVSVTYSGDVQVYDLTVPGTHNFIADDVCVHNTTLALNIAAHASVHHQIPCAIFSLETSKEQLVQRLLCAEAEVDGSKLRTGFLADADWPKLARAMGKLSEAPMFIDDSANISVIEMRAKARKLKAEHGLGLIVVDYLQMIQSYKRTENRTQEISEIARSLKSLAKELNIPLIAISQLSRAVEITGTRRPMLSHLRECVVGDTVVWDADTGRRWTVEALAAASARPRLLSMDSRGRIVPVRPAEVLVKGENAVFELRTSTGRRLRATANHPVLTPHGWKKVSELGTGSLVAGVRRLPLFAPPAGMLSPDRMRLLGYMIGDGSYQRHRGLSFISADPLTLEDCIAIAVREFGVTVRRGEANGTPEVDFVATYPNRNGALHGRPYGNPMREWLRALGVEGQSSYDKRIPDVVFTDAGPEAIRALLRALYSTDGCLTRRKYRSGTVLWSLHYDTVSRGLADDVRDLLLRFGIVAQVSSGYLSKKGTTPLYRVCIEDARHLAAFCAQVGIEGRKQVLVDRCAAELAGRRAKSQIDRLPVGVTQALWAHKKRAGITWRELGFRLQTDETLDRRRAAELALRLHADDVFERATDDILWDRVVEVIPCGSAPVFDLVMPWTHNFIANGIVVHNSGELEQVSDLVLFIYRDDYYNAETEKKNIAEIIIAKHRNGPIGSIELFFHKEHSKFANLARTRA